MNGFLKMAASALVLFASGMSYASSASFAASPTPETSDLASYKSLGFSSPTEMKNYFTVHSVTVTPSASAFTQDQLNHLFSTPGKVQSAPLEATAGAIAGDIVGLLQDPTQISTWVTLGARLWQVILNNKAVVNVTTQRFSILPVSKQDWIAMENWKGPASSTYTITAENMYGATVISHTYTVAYNYGGQVGGKGAFLANVTMIPASINVGWGFTLNSNVEVGHAVNLGTSDNPVPGVDLQLNWKMSSFISHREGADSFFVRGDGKVQHVTAGVR